MMRLANSIESIVENKCGKQKNLARLMTELRCLKELKFSKFKKHSGKYRRQPGSYLASYIAS